MANILFGGALALNPVFLSAESPPRDLMVGVSLLAVLGLLGVGLAGFYIRHLGAAGALGLLGFVVTLMGIMGLLISGLASPQPAPFWSALSSNGAGDAVVSPLFMKLSLACFLLGFLITGWSMLKAALLPLAAVVMMVSGIVVLAAGLFAAVPSISQFGTVVFGLGMLWLGFALWFDAKE